MGGDTKLIITIRENTKYKGHCRTICDLWSFTNDDFCDKCELHNTSYKVIRVEEYEKESPINK